MATNLQLLSYVFSARFFDADHGLEGVPVRLALTHAVWQPKDGMPVHLVTLMVSERQTEQTLFLDAMERVTEWTDLISGSLQGSPHFHFSLQCADHADVVHTFMLEFDSVELFELFSEYSKQFHDLIRENNSHVPIDDELVHTIIDCVGQLVRPNIPESEYNEEYPATEDQKDSAFWPVLASSAHPPLADSVRMVI
ncbi:hypothetical protein C8Q74DRAFT_1373472 [Fomes fomentarius]|nr:hypothetical protein C8Q74DRAFT_1373472 [Fomes fomentarius]